MSDRDSRFGVRPVQLLWRPSGRGYVELVLLNAGPTDHDIGYHRQVLVLAYPRQGRLIGARPIFEENAAKLQAATAELNRVLEELCS